MPRRPKGKPFFDGKVHVLTEKCPTCIFRPGNLMRLQPGRVQGMVKQAMKKESCIPCHETLSGDGAVCRGFFDRYKTQPLQIAERLKFIKFVEPPVKPGTRQRRVERF